MKRRTIMGPLLGMIACAFLAGPASAQYCWTVAGSTATVDEGDLGEVALANQNLQLNSAISSATITARYSVTGIEEDFWEVPRKMRLIVRFRDIGNGLILLTLKQQPLSSSTATNLLSFNSDSYPQVSGYQNTPSPLETGCAFGGGFSFQNNLYFIEVDMSKTLAAGNPGLQTIQVCSVPC